jgi:hypothetical protein
MLVPARALSAVEVVRQGSSLRITIPQAQPTLQVCGPVPANPGPFRAVLNAKTEDLKGRAWLHLRGMDAEGALQYASGNPDIVQLGPLPANADRVYERDVTLGPTSTHVKLCLVLDGATGTVELEDVALVPQDAPRLTKQQLAEVAAPKPEAAPPVPPVPGSVPPGPADEAEARLDGEVRFREAFNHPDHGWRVEGPDAGRVTLLAWASALRVQLAGSDVHARACGPAVAGAAGAEVVLHAETSALRGDGRLELRGLTYAGRVLKTKEGDAVRSLPLPAASAAKAEGKRRRKDEAPAAGRLEAAVDLPAGVAQVRPCVVLDGASGALELRDLAFLTPPEEPP